MASVLQQYRKALWPIFIFSFFINLSMLAMPIYLLQIYDRVLPGRSIETLAALLVMVMATILVLGALDNIRSRIVVNLGGWFEQSLGGHLFSGTLTRSVDQGEDNSAGILRDLDLVKNVVAGHYLIPLLDVVWAPIFIAALIWLHPLLGAIVCAGIAFMGLIAAINHRTASSGLGDDYQSKRESNLVIDSYLRNAGTIRAMGMQGNLIRRWDTQSQGWRTSATRSEMVNSRLQSLVKTTRMALQIIVLTVAAWLIMQGNLTAGATMASLLLMQRAVGPFERVLTSWKPLLRSRQAFERLNQRLTQAETLQQPAVLPLARGPLVVDKLRFRQSGQKHSLIGDASFAIRAGEVMAITGDSAVGKSTLARLLVGILKPSDGVITLDGYDISQYAPAVLGARVGYLPQEVELFPGTIRDNIARMGEVDIDAVITAAKLAGVHEMIQQMTLGYDTVLGPGGQYLSGAERSRIALARALYQQPMLVVLDEPDANLDNKGRAALAVTLEKLRRQGAMVILITHHPEVLRFVDNVYQLKHRRLQLKKPSSLPAKSADNTAALPANVRRIHHG